VWNVSGNANQYRGPVQHGDNFYGNYNSNNFNSNNKNGAPYLGSAGG
jgi:hypothetical protein